MTLPRPIRLEVPHRDEPSWLEIDLDRLERNAAAIRDFVTPAGTIDGRPRPRPKLCASLKKDGYGLGAGPMSHRLVRAGVDMLAVYSTAEAEPLNDRGLDVPLLVLAPVERIARTDPLYRPAVAGRLHLTVHDPAQLDALNETGQTLGIRLPVHLYVDTGIARGGLSPDELRATLRGVDRYKHLRVAGVSSHLATAYEDAEFVQEQLGRFTALLDEVGPALPAGCLRHLANSFGTFRDAATHLDMVRPGLALLGYGVDRLAGPVAADAPDLEPVVRWLSRVVHVQHYPRRWPVGYGSTHKLKRASVLGVVPVGYADGYPLALSNKASVRVRTTIRSHTETHRIHADAMTDCRVLGRVNMDQIVIDLTDVPCDDPASLKGIEVEVYGRDASACNAVPRLAELAKTHVYEMLCRLRPELKRAYLTA